MAEKSPCLCPLHMRQLGNLMRWQVGLTVAVVKEAVFRDQWEVQGEVQKKLRYQI